MVRSNAVICQNVRVTRRFLRLGCALAFALFLAGLATDAFAQRLPRSKTTEPSISSQLLKKRQQNPNARMLVTANEMIYDHRENKVHAVGGVQIYYDGNTLEADKVTYDRTTNKMFAEGSVRFKARDGNVIHAQVLEMTQDMRDGFVNSMLVETPQRTRFAATRADRTEGNVTVFQNGVYTACEPCKDDPKKPPLWQIKAARIIHNEGERKVYYENGILEVFGQPIAYLPFFYHPDPTVKRQSGFLPPKFDSSNRTGFGVEVPYFWSIAPNMDATFAAVPYTRQGVLGKAEFRHRTMTGAYAIRAAGIFQQEPEVFTGDSNRQLSGNREFRGLIEATGEFNINKRWVWGFDGALLTDRGFLNDYSLLRHGTIERTSQIYLTGQGDRSYFDIRGMQFLGLSELDNNRAIPLIHPVLDYSYYFANPVVGGELSYKVNFTSMSRQDADLAPLSAAFSDNVGKCIVASPTPGQCFVRGLPGEYSRFSAQMDWRRTMTNNFGMVFTPFARVRTDAASLRVSPEASVNAIVNNNDDTLVRGMPTVGLESRWPFISVHSWGTQTLEPIVQAIIRPNESQIGRFPNEDAQSLVFDDTNLFAIDKYSGYDRVEGGSRVNYGVQYSANVHRFGMINVLFGQSYQMFGQNSFAFSGYADPGTGQQTGLGLQSGLEERSSDYVARMYFQPTGRFSFVTRFRFDRNDLSIRRFEAETRSTWDRLTLSTIYALYEAQPLIGFLDRREGVYQTAQLRVHDYWSILGGVRYDMDSGKIDFGTVGVAYTDECFVISLTYIADYTNTLSSTAVHKFLVRMDLRTLGGTGFKSNLGNQVTSAPQN